MKFGFFKKAFTVLLLGFGLVTLGACQSVGEDARILVDKSTVQIYEEAGTGKRIATTTLGIENNTIYNTKRLGIAFTTYTAAKVKKDTHYVEDNLAIAHGSVGYYSFATTIQDDTVSYIVIDTENDKGVTKFTEYYNVWDTYLVIWICAITVTAIAWICAAAAIFGKKFTMEELKQYLAARIGASLTILALCLILCLFPLCFGSWFGTIIVLITYAACLIGAGAFVGIKALTLKKAK